MPDIRDLPCDSGTSRKRKLRKLRAVAGGGGGGGIKGNGWSLGGQENNINMLKAQQVPVCQALGGCGLEELVLHNHLKCRQS